MDLLAHVLGRFRTLGSGTELRWLPPLELAQCKEKKDCLPKIWEMGKPEVAGGKPWRE